MTTCTRQFFDELSSATTADKTKTATALDATMLNDLAGAGRDRPDDKD